jgi:hypothetical protein
MVSLPKIPNMNFSKNRETLKMYYELLPLLKFISLTLQRESFIFAFYYKLGSVYLHNQKFGSFNWNKRL